MTVFKCSCFKENDLEIQNVEISLMSSCDVRTGKVVDGSTGGWDLNILHLSPLQTAGIEAAEPLALF